jgi:phage terminase Nu1 subunit (DNA packaging protein)
MAKKNWAERISKTCNCTERTAREWLKRGCPRTTDPEKIRAWRRSQSLLRPKKRGEADDSDKWISEYRKFKAKRQRLEFLRESGKLIPRDEAIEFLTDLGRRFRIALSRVPRIIAQRIYYKKFDRDLSIEIELLGEQACNDILNQVANAEIDFQKIGLTDFETAHDPAQKDRPAVKSPVGQGSDIDSSETDRPSESGDSEVIAHPNPASQCGG